MGQVGWGRRSGMVGMEQTCLFAPVTSWIYMKQAKEGVDDPIVAGEWVINVLGGG